ncbi:MAG: response regulator transcription factor [Chloroflexi bacterium]|nr:response regulator transcription factor [Chloroflexota bacterium]
MIRVILADDHPIVRAGTRMWLARDGDVEIVGEAEDALQALGLAKGCGAEVLLLDARLPGMRTKALVEAVKKECSHLRILVLSAYKDADLVMGLLRAGVDGYLLKEEPPEAIAAGIKAVMQGGRPLSGEIVALLQTAALGEAPSVSKRDLLEELTEREREVLLLMVEGASNAAIAQALFISERTVKFHVGNIYQKLGVKNRTEAVLLALERREEWMSG